MFLEILKFIFPGRPSVDGRALLEDHVALVRRITGFVAHRRSMRHEEGEEFLSWVFEKLLENDARILTEFSGRSTLKTYLTTVILRLSVDFLRRTSGRWQPSAQATRLGPVAIELERMVHRDGRSREEAVQTVLSRHKGAIPEKQLTEMAADIDRAPAPRTVDDGPLADFPDQALRPDQGEEAPATGRLLAWRKSFAREAGRLSGEEKLVLVMRFRDGLPPREIASRIGADARHVSKRIEKALEKLRRRLGQAGIQAEAMEAVIADKTAPLPLDFRFFQDG